MKTPKKNSIISKMIRHPFWMFNCKAQLSLPKTSCGYFLLGVIFSVLSIHAAFVYCILLTGLLCGLYATVSDLSLMEVLNPFTEISPALGMIAWAGNIMPSFLLLLWVSKENNRRKVEGCLDKVVMYVIVKPLKWLFSNTLALKVYTVLGNLLKPLVTSLTSLYKSIHKKLCVPMEYKDE